MSLQLDSEVPEADASAVPEEDGIVLLYTHGVLLRDSIKGNQKQQQQPKQQQEQQQHENHFHDRVFGLETLSRLLSHNFDLNTAAAGVRQQNTLTQQQQSRGEVEVDSAMQQDHEQQQHWDTALEQKDAPCASSAALCQRVLLESLLQQQAAFTVSKYLPSLGVEVITFSKLKLVMQVSIHRNNSCYHCCCC